MFVQAKELKEWDLFDLEPLLHWLQDNGKGEGISEFDWDRSTYEYARISEIEAEESGLVILHTSLGSWAVAPDTLIDFVSEQEASS